MHRIRTKKAHAFDLRKSSTPSSPDINTLSLLMMVKEEEYKSAYVFAPDITGAPVLAGKISLTSTAGEFTYADSWLALEWAYPLDPINLPLSVKRYSVSAKRQVSGVFLDAAPDNWGETIMLLRHKSVPRNQIEKLLRLSGAGVGGLHFSLSRTKPKIPESLPAIELLDNLALAISDIEQKKLVTPDQLKLIENGSSMGGARPKVSVFEKSTGKSWLVKFSKSADDMFDYPVVEYASMTFLASLGVRVPQVKLFRLSNTRSCYLIERFDRLDHGLHFISANSLFNIEKMRIYDKATHDPASYVALARILRKIANDSVGECRELFKRMLINILVGNTDDHGRNVALQLDLQNRLWSLTPVYDVLPILSSAGLQALSVGLDGRKSSIANALSCAKEFMLTEKESESIVKQIVDAFEGWKEHFVQAGVSSGDMQLIENVIGPK